MCIPCQTIRWDGYAIYMIETVTEWTKIHLAGGKIPISEAWLQRWYEGLEDHCKDMSALMDEITNVPVLAGGGKTK